MRRLRAWALRLAGMLHRGRSHREFNDELDAHLQLHIDDNLHAGMSAVEARRNALIRLGGTGPVLEMQHERRGIPAIETLAKDARYAFRTLARTPGFTIVIVLTLALSIGANSAIFSVIEGVLLRPLPYVQPDRLVRIYFSSATQAKFPLNPNDFRDFRARNRTFESVAAITRHDVQLSGAGDPIMLRAFNVTAGYFHTLGFSPVRGREFTTDDELPGPGRLAILSDHLWRTQFGSDPKILGRAITLDAQPFVVAGVMPPGVRHPGNNFHAVADGDTVDLWFPFTFDGNVKARGSHFMDTMGRLKPGVSAEQANANLSEILNQLMRENTGKGWRVFLVPLYQETVGQSRRMLLVLLGAVGLLLLIACVNAANLLLARSSARVREIAVRSALGAARGRIIRQLLTESLAIALAGAALGTALAFGGVRALVAFLPSGFPRAAEVRLDAGVFAFTLLIALLTGFLFGLVPALTASRTDLQQSLREGGRGSMGSSRQLRLRNFLVVGETGLACVLLITAGLMLHSFVNLLHADPGFRPEHVLTASISLPFEHYKNDPQRIRLFEQLIANLEALPGVQAAGAGSDVPWTGYDENSDGFTIEGRSAAYNSKTTGRYHAASPGYFRAMGIPLLHGRIFDGRDNKDAPTVLVINDAMAKRYWPGEDALGKRVTFRSEPTEKDWMRVIGVVGDVKDQADSSSVRPAFWWPYAQASFRNMSVVVRSSSDSSSVANQLRAALRQLDPGLALSDLRMMHQVVDASVSSQRFALFLVGLFAVLALLLASIGMYGVISYGVNQRMPEFGMRLALGARPRDLMWLIVGHGLRLAVAGAAIGLVAAAGLAKLLGSLVYGIGGADPVTFAGVGLLALATAALACYVPARRAADADPMTSLRAE